MRRSRKPKQPKQNPKQKQALKYLSLISERETGYLQDWALINEIKQKDIESSNELQSPANNQQREQGNQERNAVMVALRERTGSRSRDRNTEEMSDRKVVEVRVQDFASIPQRKTLIKIRRSELDLYKHEQSQLQFHTPVHQQPQTTLEQDPAAKSKLRHSSSMNYIDKIRKLSLPWVKQLPRHPKNQVQIEEEMRAREETRRLNEIIKNKIRRKHSNKYILQRQQQKQRSQLEQKAVPKAQQQAAQVENSQIKILRSWLDYNRSKRKRSITSLLNQNFQCKYLEKKKQREKTLAMKSLKVITTLSNINHRYGSNVGGGNCG